MDDPAKVAASKEFITLFHPKTDPRYIAKQLDQAMPHMIEAAKSNDPKLDVKKFEHDKRTLIMTNTGKMLDRQAHVFSRHFTLQELQGLIAFCKSPLGHKLAAETAKIQEEMLMWNRQTKEEDRQQRVREAGDKDAPDTASKPVAPKGGPAPAKVPTPPAKPQK